jgi:Arc/MetJ-type ribon-helix-helix transcriptional regulator
MRIADRYAARMPQLVTRVEPEMVDAIDSLIAAGAYETRSDVVRAAIGGLVDRHRRDEIGRQIVEGYRRMPQTEEELDGVDEAAVAMVLEEPW